MSLEILQRQIHDGNIHKKVPSSAYDTQIRPMISALSAEHEIFDPKKHLTFKPSMVHTIKRASMKELGAECDDQISDIGVSEPFPLFTEEACDIMRAEILREEVFRDWARISMNSTTGLDAVIRGYAKETCPFTYSAWTHPETVFAVSSMAGVELEVIMDYEVAHVNVAIKSANEAENERVTIRRKEAMKDSYDDDIPAVVGWHNDSYPFVCVLMLSDTEGMIGGETLIKTGSGEIIAAKGPAKGKATVLQGRKLLHLASIPLGYTERITAVTSYRAKDSMKPDTSVLSTVKPEVNYGSMYNKFYPEWISYRMKVISDREKFIKEKINGEMKLGKEFDKEEAIRMIKGLEEYVKGTWEEMMS
ncbi:DEKNAAC105295 [Brettanomyces naardenensis]|uniref:DEKNAAC105295 n=1 Tax=Brettanomyces naardenensis TaxID=13370 RepID=A0A448YSY7_BRENA|nr:DEKNAAC105295 [Brettanomyces naardenensis]